MQGQYTILSLDAREGNREAEQDWDQGTGKWQGRKPDAGAFHCLEKQVSGWNVRNTFYRMLGKAEIFWDFPTSLLFILLPSDLDSWDDSDTSTHLFRLHFLCHNYKEAGVREDMPQHVYLSNHPGYNLTEPQEFVQKYGDYVLRVLLMLKYGYSHGECEIPPLSTFNILWNCDMDIFDVQLTRKTLQPLVDKAIAHLQYLSLPKWKSNLG